MLYGCDSQFHNTLGYSDYEWSRFSNDEKNKLIAKGNHARQMSNDLGFGSAESVTVSFISGQAMMNDSQYTAFKRADIYINNGGCGQVALKSKDNDSKAMIDVCFKDNAVLIDSDWTAMSGYGLRLFKNSMWYRGLKYSDITSKGSTQLKDSLILISLHTV